MGIATFLACVSYLALGMMIDTPIRWWLKLICIIGLLIFGLNFIKYPLLSLYVNTVKFVHANMSFNFLFHIFDTVNASVPISLLTLYISNYAHVSK